MLHRQPRAEKRADPGVRIQMSIKSSPADIDPLDLVDPERFARRGYPHAVWTRLRAEAPVAWFDSRLRKSLNFHRLCHCDGIATQIRCARFGSQKKSPRAMMLHRFCSNPAMAGRSRFDLLAVDVHVYRTVGYVAQLSR